MHKLLKVPIALSLSALAMAAMAPDTQAQSFNFSTTGYFTSGVAECNQDTPALAVSCEDPGSSLAMTFLGRDWTTDEPFGFLAGSTVTLGQFNVSGQGSASPMGNSVLFTLVINQSSPTVGTGQTVGAITGTITRGPGGNFSNLIWSPDDMVFIDPVLYSLIFRDNAPGIVIAAAGSTTIEAIGTVAAVPEPASMVLLGTGLFGLVGVAHRRRRKALELD